MNYKNTLSAVLIAVLLMTTVVSSADTLGQSCDVDNTPEYFPDSFSALQGIELDAFVAGLDTEFYGFLAAYVAQASICICNPQVNEPEDDDMWVFHEFVLEGITLEDAKTLFEDNTGNDMFSEEGCYGYEYDGHGFGLCYQTDWDGNTTLQYSIAMKSQFLPNIKTIEEYNQITDILLPSDDKAYLNTLRLDYDAVAKDVTATYEYTYFSGQIHDAYREYCDTVSQIEGNIDKHNQLTSIIRPGVYLTARLDLGRYDDIDALVIQVSPLPVSVFSCGFDEQLNATLKQKPVPAVIADLLDIVIPSFTDYEIVLSCVRDSMTVVLHSETYTGRQFDQDVFAYLDREGESEGSADEFWCGTDDCSVSFRFDADDSYARFEIQGDSESLLDYGQAVMEAYPYALMPVFPDTMDIAAISYPITVSYNAEQKAFSYQQTDVFTMRLNIHGSADESGVLDYLLCAYPSRYPAMSDLTVKGVPTFIQTEYFDHEDITSIEISFRNSDILGHYTD